MMSNNHNYKWLLMPACVLALTAQVMAQGESTPGTPGQPVQAVHIYNSIRDAEMSPLNRIHKGPVQQNLQGLRSKERIKQDVVFPDPPTPDQLQSTPVYQLPDPEQYISASPDPSTSERLAGGQLPSYTFEANAQNGWIPSDAQGAAGPNHLVYLANGNARIIRKSDRAIVSDVTLDAFFGWTGTFDPRIFYDPYNARWVALALKGSSGPADSKFRLFISNNSDPTAGWYFYELDVDGTNTCWLDFAMLGFNNNWIVVAGNTPGCGTGVDGIYAFNKAQAYSGGTTNFWTWDPVGNLAPAFTYDNTQPTLYFVRTFNGNSGGNGYCQTYSMTGTVNAPSLNVGNLVAVNFTWAGNSSAGGTNPRQLGSNVRFDFVTVFGASMYSNCVYRNGYLWWTHPVFLPATGTTNRTSTLWWQANPSTGVAQQVGLIDDGSGVVSTFYPNIAVNSANDAVISYCQFSPNYYQSASYSWHNGTDPAGALSGGVFYASGGNINTSTRTGDYGASFVDPLDDNSIWSVNQISSSTADYWVSHSVLIPYYYGCFTNATFGNVAWYGNTKNEASGTITSQEMISGSSIVDYDAGVEVILQPGFAAYQGTQFHAYINGCGGARMMGGGIKGEGVAKNNTIPLSQNVPSTGQPFRLFPNPAFDRVTLNYTLSEKETSPEFLMFDANMKLVKSVVLNPNSAGYINTAEISLSDIRHGVYICHFITNTRKEISKLVIVK